MSSSYVKTLGFSGTSQLNPHTPTGSDNCRPTHPCHPVNIHIDANQPTRTRLPVQTASPRAPTLHPRNYILPPSSGPGASTPYHLLATAPQVWPSNKTLDKMEGLDEQIPACREDHIKVMACHNEIQATTT